MKNSTALALALVALAIAGPVAASDFTGQAKILFVAQVISNIPGQTTCRTIQVQDPAQQQQQQNSGMGQMGGTIVGGLVGGLIGTQVGNGTGKQLATVGGSVAGAVIGGNMASGQPQRGSHPEQQCQQSAASQVTEGYDVTYLFEGQNRTDRLRIQQPPAVGSMIQVRGTVNPVIY